jgi:2-polyprenyl-6-methoxyphenol hydroxylase-like FAD-dependent oxidoreductase
MKADVLVVGGGPAGATTALLLARAGMRVVLCESWATLPDRVCGMYLCPAGVALLDQLGLGRHIGAEARILSGMVLVSPGFQRLETRFPKVAHVPSHGLALPRPALDNALLDAARGTGVTVLMGCRPTLTRTPHGWRAQSPGTEPVEARLLVGADGRKSTTARLLGLTLPVRRSRVAIHIDCAARRAAPPMGQMHVFPDGTYIGLNPVREDTVNVSLVCDPSELRQRSATQAINRRLGASPHLSSLVTPVAADTRPGVTFPANARVRSATTNDAALVGDASGYIDPLTGEGIFAALWTAETLASRVTAGWTDLPAALAAYARARARTHRAKSMLCEIFQQCLRRPWLADGIVRALGRRQSVADSFIGIVGNSYTPVHGFMRMASQSLAH